MSTPEQPDTPQLTRRQLREIRNTGVTPVVTPEDLEKAAAETPAPEQPEQDVQPDPEPTPAPAPVSAPLARPAEPVPVAEPPAADASVDLGVSPLTRRQARQQERIRTASVPVITPEVAAAHAQTAGERAEGAQGTDEEAQDASEPNTEEQQPDEPHAPVDTPSWWPAVAAQVPPLVDEDGAPEPARESDEQRDAEAAAETDLLAEAEDEAGVEGLFAPLAGVSDDSADAEARSDAETAPEPAEADGPRTGERPILNPRFGAGLLAGESQTDQLPPSFDQLITRSTTGSVATTNALIMSQPSGPSPIVAPVTATGDVLVTGTLNLPEGLGSTGHAPGAADGKEVDAVLVDGELPAHSSPTPIAASAAVSTVKTTGDVIRPPAPEKGSKLMISLAITAGVLALALVGVLIVAIVTGVFQ